MRGLRDAKMKERDARSEATDTKRMSDRIGYLEGDMIVDATDSMRLLLVNEIAVIPAMIATIALDFESAFLVHSSVL